MVVVVGVVVVAVDVVVVVVVGVVVVVAVVLGSKVGVVELNECGGEILVEDWGRGGRRREWRNRYKNLVGSAKLAWASWTSRDQPSRISPKLPNPIQAPASDKMQHHVYTR